MSCVGGGLEGTVSESVNEDKFDLLYTGSRPHRFAEWSLALRSTTLFCCWLHSNHSQPSYPRQHIPWQSETRPPHLYVGDEGALALVQGRELHDGWESVPDSSIPDIFCTMNVQRRFVGDGHGRMSAARQGRWQPVVASHPIKGAKSSASRTSYPTSRPPQPIKKSRPPVRGPL